MQIKRTVFLTLPAVAALLLTACGQADNHQAIVQALKDNEAQWNNDFAAKDADKLVAHYADNAVLMSPGMPAANGKADIRKIFVEMVGDPALSLQFHASRVEVSQSGDMAFTQGSYQMTMTDAASKKVIHDHGSYVTTYSKQPDGSWKAVADIATSEVPPVPPPAPATGSK